MKEGQDIFSLIEAGRALNSKVFSLVRLELLASLAPLRAEGALYRDLKAALRLSDGSLYANLQALEKMGYVSKQEVEFAGKKLDVFAITPEGQAALNKTLEWLKNLVENVEGESRV